MRAVFFTRVFGKKRTLFFLIPLFFFMNRANAQTITGSVKDETGNALPGVTIVVKDNTAIGTATNPSGNYSLGLPSPVATITFSYIGYRSQDINVNSRSVIDVVLIRDQLNLNEVVVTGYTTQQKKDITGSVASVDMKSMASIPAGSAMQALQGQAAGVNVLSSGVPGAPSMILVRGVTSFGDNQPLVLIDGVQGDLNSISADDIESMQVLKDAGAAAIYGVRGSNGVIVVTTKKGKSGAPTINYHGYYGTQRPRSGNPLNLMNAEQYAWAHKIAYPNTILFANGLPDYLYGGSGGRGVGMEGDATVDPAKYLLDPQNPLNNYLIQKVNKAGTDWYNEFFRPAPMTNHTITASGGTDKSAYLLSLGYLDQQGPIIETFLKRYTARINTQFKLPGNIRVGDNAAIIYSRSTGFDNRQGEFGPVYSLYNMLPIIPIYDIMGNFGSTFAGPAEMGNMVNPVATQKSNGNDRHHAWDIVGNIYAEIDPFKHFTVRTSFGGTLHNQYDQVFTPNQYWAPNEYNVPNRYRESSGYGTTTMWTNTASYGNTFGKHSIKVLVGSEALRNYGRTVGGAARRFFATNFDYLVLGNGTENITNFSSAYTNTLFSVFGRLDYSFNDKYLAAVTIRRDGSSRFGSKKRYGTFPSYSIGWRLSNESFMKGITFLTDLKLRASYGILGSQNNISASNPFTLFGGSIGGAYYDVTGSSNSTQQGFYQTNIGNPFTGWEEDVITNAGFDATLFNKLSISVDVYKKSVNGLLFTQPLPSTVGGALPPYVNIGDIQNSGVDAAVKYIGSLGPNTRFNVAVNITTYKNVVKDIPGPGYFDGIGHQQLGRLVRNQENEPVSAFFGYEVVGIFNSDDDVTKSPAQTGAAPGRFRYRDVNGDGTITPEDRKVLGSPNPDFTYGVNLGFEYKGFDLAAFFYGSQGNELINTLKVNTHFFGVYTTNKSLDLLNAWTPDKTNTNIPKIEGISSFSTSGAMNSFFVENGSYLRLRSLMLGYSFNRSFINKVGLRKLRPYLQATNLFTITKYPGLDPEMMNASQNFGIDWGNYPNNIKNFIVGIEVTF